MAPVRRTSPGRSPSVARTLETTSSRARQGHLCGSISEESQTDSVSGPSAGLDQTEPEFLSSARPLLGPPSCRAAPRRRTTSVESNTRPPRRSRQSGSPVRGEVQLVARPTTRPRTMRTRAPSPGPAAWARPQLDSSFSQQRRRRRQRYHSRSRPHKDGTVPLHRPSCPTAQDRHAVALNQNACRRALTGWVQVWP
jgi:hypothetical protein